MKLGKILTHEDLVRVALPAFVRQHVQAQHGTQVADSCRAVLEAGETGAGVVLAEVNAGRWIVRCTNCPGAQLAHRTVRRFWCSGCLNAHLGHLWAAVAWPEPDEVASIEAILMERPQPATRNWLPHESVMDLTAENAAHGIGGDR